LRSTLANATGLGADSEAALAARGEDLAPLVRDLIGAPAEVEA
jgi:hypothetical protein